MKKLLLIQLLLLTAFAVSAQDKYDSWKVKLNNKTLLSTHTEDVNANTKKIKLSEWKKNGYLEIIYKNENYNEKEYSRSLFLNDETDHELIRKDGVTTLKISIKQLKKTFSGSKKIIIYTTIAPTDPEVAARVRIRRVHLYTLELP
jgi:hypothetical protein